MSQSTRYRRSGAIAACVIGAGVLTLIGTEVLGISLRGGDRGTGSGTQQQLPTTMEDFFQPGTQPDPSGEIVQPIIHSNNCVACHGQYLLDEKVPSYAEAWDGWINSIKGHTARDPIWKAAVAIANQDAAGAGEYCIRCHVPRGWLAGRSETGLVEDLDDLDFDGVNCHFCHRVVNPVLTKDSPKEDGPILAALDFPPTGAPGNARWVLDPNDVRRGPFDDVPLNMHGEADIIFSPFHLESAMCGT